jgi:hypothetical protein
MRAVVGGGIVLLDGRARKEDEEMNYQMHFDPYQTEHLNQRHKELLQQMEVLRLEERLRENRGGYVCDSQPSSGGSAAIWARVCKVARRHALIGEELRRCRRTEAKAYCS